MGLLLILCTPQTLLFLTNKCCPYLKNLTFSLVNTVLNYDCDGYLIPYASNIQPNRYVDPFFKISLQLVLVLLNFKPPLDLSSYHGSLVFA